MRIEDLALTFVLNALWQVPAAIAVAALGARLLRRGPARHRHALWVAALAAGVLLPAASLLPREAPRATVPAAPAPAALQRAGGGAPAAWLPLAGSAEPAAFPPLLVRAVVLLWGLSFAAHLVRLGRAWRRTRRLAREARPAGMPERAAAVAERCRKAFGLGPVEILCTDRVGGPVTLGACRPAILLPEGFLAGSPDDHLTAAFGHEMAHIRRRDYAVHLLCEILLLPVAFHPAVRPLRRRLAESRETACDEAAVERLIGPRAYARSLLSMASTLAGRSRPACTLGALDADLLEVRMRRLTDAAPRLGARPARTRLALAALLLAAASLTAASLACNAAAAPAAGDLSSFLGVWTAEFPAENGPLPGVEMTVLQGGGQPAVSLTFFRHRKQPDGSLRIDPVTHRVTDVRATGRTMRFRTQGTYQYRPDLPRETVEFDQVFELTAGDQGVLRAIWSSHEGRADAPPPSPPIRLRKRAG